MVLGNRLRGPRPIEGVALFTVSMFSHLRVRASVFTLALGLLLLVAGEASLGPPHQRILPLHWWPSSGTEDTILCLKAPALPPENSSCAGRILPHCSIWSPD